MKVIVHENRNGEYKVKFSQGVQTFTIDYHPTQKEEAEWIAERLRDAFKAFADELIANNLKDHCTCEFPIIRNDGEAEYCGDCEKDISCPICGGKDFHTFVLQHLKCKKCDTRFTK